VRNVATSARQLPPREIEPERRSVTEPPDGDEPPTADTSIFDTDISELFPKRARFGVIDVLLIASLVVWLAVLSDVRVWVEDGVVSFATASARAGVTRAAVLTPPETEPELAENVDNLEDVEPDDDDVPTNAAVPETEPLPPASVSMRNGNRLFENGEFRAAVAQFEATVAVAPDDAEGWNNLGQTLVRLDRQTEAVPHFEEAVRLNPGCWAYHFNLGHTLGDLGWWRRAIVQYRHAVALFPDDFATHYNLGRALHVWGDDRAAIAPYLKAIALAPGEPSFYLSLRTELRGPRPPC
jgi:tetratricopeptide (TPR) repeat protein